LSMGEMTSSDADRPFHRRDLNVIETVEPNSGAPRISVFGGVFKPGVLAAYGNPVHIDSPSQATVERSIEQKFNQYEAAVIPVYDASRKEAWHHIVGGISGYYFHQTPMQKCVRDERTKAGASDGLPFSADVSIMHLRSDGSYEEYIDDRPIPPRANPALCPKPWPAHPERCAGITNPCEGKVSNTCGTEGPAQCNDIMGSSVRFIANHLLGPQKITERGVIRLDQLQPGERVLAGYILGGIRSDFAFPLRFGCGTCTSDRLLSVYVTNTPSAAYPAGVGMPAVNTRGQPGKGQGTSE
jgi:hypothetical protein